MRKAVFFGFLFIIVITSKGQNPVSSESLIKYDVGTHKTDKPIPFDRPFTLIIEKLSAKNVKYIQAYEVAYTNGKRSLAIDTIEMLKNDDGTIVIDSVTKKPYPIPVSIYDVGLGFNSNSDTLQVYFPALKPNKYYDINIVTYLPDDCKKILMEVNNFLSDDSLQKAANELAKVGICAEDKIFDRRYLSVDSAEYEKFFAKMLKTHYINLKDSTKYKVSPFLQHKEIQAIDISTTRELTDFKDGHILIEIERLNNYAGIQLGLVDVKKIFQLYLPDSKISITDFPGRVSVLESNLKFFDSVHKRNERVISKGIETIPVNGSVINLDSINKKIVLIVTSIQQNLNFLKGELKSINKAINNDKRLSYGVYLAGNTVSSDLKTAGGTVLFVDAGFANIWLPGARSSMSYVPKLYTGVSIYFRPIDKNTRRNKFSKDFDPARKKGCDSTGNNCGPDYNIVTRRTILQNLSLNIGLTFGSMQNKEFDNFYNGSSLLIGPAYRFKRAFKVSGGVALARATSKNPLISEKRVVAGPYFSLSVDIDFIESIKSITSILFK